MKFYYALLLTVIISIYVLAGCSRNKGDSGQIEDLPDLVVTPAMKGWELYTWPEANTWKFSFLVGTNRLKSLTEVKSSNGETVLIRVSGVDSAKMVLNKFPKGEAIMLIGQDWLRNAWQGQHGDLQLPPQTIIDELSTFAARKNVEITVAN